MASPFSGLVLVAGAALTSPTLYAAFVVGTVPLEDALTRLVTVVAITTVALTLVEWLFQETSPLSESQLELSRRLTELAGPKGGANAAAPSADGASSSGADDTGPAAG